MGSEVQGLQFYSVDRLSGSGLVILSSYSQSIDVTLQLLTCERPLIACTGNVSKNSLSVNIIFNGSVYFNQLKIILAFIDLTAP
jgi:hypothetical protein